MLRLPGGAAVRCVRLVRTMKSVILYSQLSPSHEHQMINTGDKITPQIHIRAEVVAGYAPEALDKAIPRDGETLLNSIELSTDTI